VSTTLSGADCGGTMKLNPESVRTFGSFAIDKKKLICSPTGLVGVWTYGGSKTAYSAFTYDNTSKVVTAGFCSWSHD